MNNKEKKDVYVSRDGTLVNMGRVDPELFEACMVLAIGLMDYSEEDIRAAEELLEKNFRKTPEKVDY